MVHISVWRPNDGVRLIRGMHDDRLTLLRVAKRDGGGSVGASSSHTDDGLHHLKRLSRHLSHDTHPHLLDPFSPVRREIYRRPSWPSVSCGFRSLWGLAFPPDQHRCQIRQWHIRGTRPSIPQAQVIRFRWLRVIDQEPNLYVIGLLEKCPSLPSSTTWDEG